MFFISAKKRKLRNAVDDACAVHVVLSTYVQPLWYAQVDKKLDIQIASGALEDFDIQEDTETSYINQQQRRQEFIKIMEQRFLTGLDEEFDYESVDNNELYDFNKISADAEDKYF